MSAIKYLLIALAFLSRIAQERISYANYDFLVCLENKVNGRVLLKDLSSGTEKADKTYLLGNILRPATSIRTQSFRASRYGEGSVVAASAVNAIHLKVYAQADLGKGASISIYPKELFGKSLSGAPHKFLDYVIYTDIPAGRFLFGGSFSPAPGNEVRVKRNSKELKLAFGYVPAIGDSFEIHVKSPSEPVRRFVFENKVKGRVLLESLRGTKQVVAVVVKPVTAVGRFEGGSLASPGSIRAVHSAVIDICTSPRGFTGGFQITPIAHTYSRELLKAHILPQYMLLAPVGDSRLEGEPPLFRDYLPPRVNDVTEPELVALTGEKVALSAIPHVPQIRILGDFGNGFEPMPVKTGRDENALVGLLMLAIEFVQ